MNPNIKCSYTDIVGIDTLKPYPHNENKHSQRQIEALAKIIANVGQRSPVVVSLRSGYITKGHGRLEAIKLLGWDQCAIDEQDYKSELEEIQDRVADNEIARYAEFDRIVFENNISNFDIDNVDFEMFGLIDYIDISDICIDDLIVENTIKNSKKELICPYCGKDIYESNT